MGAEKKIIEVRVYRRKKSTITNLKCIYIERARSDVINVEQENKFKSAVQCTQHTHIYICTAQSYTFSQWL